MTIKHDMIAHAVTRVFSLIPSTHMVQRLITHHIPGSRVIVCHKSRIGVNIHLQKGDVGETCCQPAGTISKVRHAWSTEEMDSEDNF